MILEYDDIFDKVQMLSSYEGGRITDAQGESLYEEVHVTEQDKDRIIQLARESCTAIQAAARYAFEDVSYDATGVTMQFGTGNNMNQNSSALQVAKEVVVSYIMQHWLEDKNAERSKSWGEVFTNMLASLVRIAYRKHAPKLDDYDD